MSATPQSESAAIHIDYCWSFCVARGHRLTDCDCPCHATEKEPSLTVEEASELVGDDIAYWLANPFMTPDMLAEKAAWWISRARVLLPGSSGARQ